ncbi:MAG TPA: tetratricopeptide repeat protein [Deferrisomatales bacterium]|nr:tetratricopeptide repeat protein [Deferrisomatales bacterium]
MKVPRILALLLLCLAVVVPAHADRDDATALYKKGLRSYRAGQLEGAIALFRASEEADPTYPFPAFALGRIYHELFDQETRHYQDAVDAYTRLQLLLQANPPAESQRALYQAYYFLGLLQLKGGEYENALDSLHTFQRLEPAFSNPGDVLNAIGIALYYLDQYDQAVEAFRQALVLDPDYAEARFNLRSVFTRLAAYNEAVAISRVGELELAMEKVQQLKEWAPRYLPGRRLEAKLYQEMGREDEALRVYEEILGVDQTHPITYVIRLNMAQLLVKRQQRERALELLEQALQLFPQVEDERSKRQVLQLAQQLRGDR